ncbi:unnamed protein product [Ceratitis capitata]|uniref:(Mediterranean fruit fly) hypothetical protein n=1 Tax=Ceratitis capitata TaxID=7213 RepID=A0A811U7Q6_CERCA|nr:unnamed protein product [Ceratitis capitata]
MLQRELSPQTTIDDEAKPKNTNSILRGLPRARAVGGRAVAVGWRQAHPTLSAPPYQKRVIRIH